MRRLIVAAILWTFAFAADAAIYRGPSPQGNSPLEIHQKFPATVLHNLQAAGYAGIPIARLSNVELAHLVLTFANANGGNVSPLLNATRPPFASAGIFARVYGAYLAVKPLIKSTPLLTTDLTLEEIYLELRTATVGGLSPASAFSETMIFAGSRLVPAYAAGYTVGTVIHNLIETFDPSLNDAIGKTLDQSIADLEALIQAILDAQTASATADAEYFSDAYFGFPISDSGDPWGDYLVSYDLGSDPF